MGLKRFFSHSIVLQRQLLVRFSGKLWMYYSWHNCLFIWHVSVCVSLQHNPNQQERMAHAPQLPLPHCRDVWGVCRRHQPDQVPCDLSSGKSTLFIWPERTTLFMPCVYGSRLRVTIAYGLFDSWISMVAIY